MFYRLFKHLEFRQKYSAAPLIFNSLLGVFDMPMKNSLVFDILLEKHELVRKNVISARKLTSQGDPVNTICRLFIVVQDMFTGMSWIVRT